MIQIKIDKQIRKRVETSLEPMGTDFLELEIIDVESDQDVDYLFEQALLYVKDGQIELSRLIAYYQTPFLLPSTIPYTDGNLRGAILFLIGKYNEAKDNFEDTYLKSISEMVTLYKERKLFPKELVRNIIDNIVEDSIYYSNMAVVQHYNSSNADDLLKLKYLYEQAIKYVSNYTDELHLLKYYMLLYTQYGLFDDAKMILRHSLNLSEPLAINFKSMLDKAYVSYLQNQKTSLQFQDVPYYFINQFLVS